VKQRIVEDAESRRTLCDRFLFAQQFFQTDPWADKARAEAPKEEFKLLAMVAP
jgi:nitrite reductase (NADH) large subunit